MKHDVTTSETILCSGDVEVPILVNTKKLEKGDVLSVYTQPATVSSLPKRLGASFLSAGPPGKRSKRA